MRRVAMVAVFLATTALVGLLPSESQAKCRKRGGDCCAQPACAPAAPVCAQPSCDTGCGKKARRIGHARSRGCGGC
jgi:hypothetical protein